MFEQGTGSRAVKVPMLQPEPDRMLLMSQLYESKEQLVKAIKIGKERQIYKKSEDVLKLIRTISDQKKGFDEQMNDTILFIDGVIKSFNISGNKISKIRKDKIATLIDAFKLHKKDNSGRHIEDFYV